VSLLEAFDSERFLSFCEGVNCFVNAVDFFLCEGIPFN